MSNTANKYGTGDTDDHYDCRTSQVIDENEPEEGDMSSVMVHTCECCGGENEVLPPHGFRVKSVALTEAVATFRALYSGPALFSSSDDALQAFHESYRSLEVAR